jgi:hypothetical protein
MLMAIEKLIRAISLIVFLEILLFCGYILARGLYNIVISI